MRVATITYPKNAKLEEAGLIIHVGEDFAHIVKNRYGEPRRISTEDLAEWLVNWTRATGLAGNLRDVVETALAMPAHELDWQGHVAWLEKLRTEILPRAIERTKKEWAAVEEDEHPLSPDGAPARRVGV